MAGAGCHMGCSASVFTRHGASIPALPVGITPVTCMAHGIFQQIAQQQAQTGGVQPLRRQLRWHLKRDLYARVARLQLSDDAAGHDGQVQTFPLQSDMAIGQALAFQQILHQGRHLPQVTQQGLTLRAYLRVVLGQQFGVQACAGQWAAHLMTDGQQQAALGIQHLPDVFAHGVERRGQLAQLPVPPGPGSRNGVVKAALAEAAGTGADGIQRPERAAHVPPGQQRQQQQRNQPPGQRVRAIMPCRHGMAVDAEHELMPIGRRALGDLPDLLPAGGLFGPSPPIPDTGTMMPRPALIMTFCSGHGSIPRWPTLPHTVTLMPPVMSRLLGVRCPSDDRSLDAHRHRQALCQCTGAFNTGMTINRDLLGQTVDIIDQQRLGCQLPARGHHLPHGADEHDHQRRCQHQKHQHHAQLDREYQACRKTAHAGKEASHEGAPPGEPTPDGLHHASCGRSASA